MEVDAPRLSASAVAAKQERDALEQAVALRRRERTFVSVPTADATVRRVLRELQEPITLFGEEAVHRRERLRALLVAREANGLSIPSWTADVGAPEVAVKRNEMFFTEGSDELKRTRLWVAQASVQRAKRRLHDQRAQQAEADAALEQRNARTAAFKSFTVTGSQVGDTRRLGSIHLSSDDAYALVSSWSGGVRVWDARTAALAAEVQAHTDRCVDAVFSPVCDVAKSLQAGADTPSALCFASGGIDSTVKLWSLAGGQPELVRAMGGHTERVCRLAFHPTGRLLGSTSFDCTWRLWDAETSTCLSVQEGHSRYSYGIAFHGDGSLVATSGVDSHVWVWDLRTGRHVLCLRGHAKQVLAVDWSPSGFQLASGSEDNTVRIWDIRGKTCAYTLGAHCSMVSALRYSACGQFLVTGSYDHTARVWSINDWRLLRTLNSHSDSVTSVDVASDASFIVTSSFDRSWKRWTADVLAELDVDEK